MKKELTLFDFLGDIEPKDKNCVEMIQSCLTYYSNWDRTNYFWTQKSSWNGKFYYELFADDIGLERVEELFDKCVEIFKNHASINRNASDGGGYYSTTFQ